MKGPEMKCPDCGMELTQVSHWSEKVGIYFETICRYCGWKEDL